MENPTQEMTSSNNDEAAVVFPPYRWFVLFVACFAVGTMYIHMTSIAPILGTIAEQMNLTMGQATQLFTARMLGEAVWMVFVGWYVDKHGISKAIIVGLFVGLLSVLATPLISGSYAGFLVARFLQAIAIGTIFPVVGYVAAHWFPEREHGLANGLFFGSVCVGAAVGALLSPFIMSATGSWEWTIVILGIFNVIGIVFAYMVAGKKGPMQEMADQGQTEVIENPMTYADTLKFPITWIGMLIVFANAWIFFGLTNFIPAFLAEPQPMGAGLGAETAGVLNLALTLIGILAVLLGGWFFDTVMKGKAKIPVALGFVSTMVAFLLIYQGVQASMFLIVVILMLGGFGIPFQNPALSAYVVKVYQPEVAGSMIGFWFGGGTFGAAVGLFVGSILIEKTGSFNSSLVLISIAAVVGFILTVLYLKHNLIMDHPRSRENAKEWTR